MAPSPLKETGRNMAFVTIHTIIDSGQLYSACPESAINAILLVGTNP